ncbi:MAG: Na+/H+ antiporter subunit E [Desulfobacteraceae bacterium]
MTGSDTTTSLKRKKPGSGILKRTLSFLLTFFFMFGLWIILSGKFEPLMIFFGLLSSFLVSWFFYDLIFPDLAFRYISIFFRFFTYAAWLIKEIIKANFHMMYLVFHPRMKELIDPQIIVLETTLQQDIAITTMANSITLTPGTITVTADSDGIFRVHAIDRASAEALPGKMYEKVADLFGEER